MTMPIDLVLVRHGESEGNRAKKLSKAGKGHEVPDGFYERHSSSFRLTDRGIQQAHVAGAWLRKEFPQGFDRYACSEFIRAMETAAHLKLPLARWHRDYRLQERDWGELDAVHPDERRTAFAKILKKMKTDSFNTPPPSGESIAQLCHRLWQGMHHLHERHSDKQVIWVCHGEVMWGMRYLLERMTQPEWCVLDASKDPRDRIHNCQVIHYTRRDPQTRRLSAHLSWMRSVLPEDTEKSSNAWTHISHRTFSNEQLLAEVEVVQRMVNEPPSQ